jgi:hypothetical protein
MFRSTGHGSRTGSQLLSSLQTVGEERGILRKYRFGPAATSHGRWEG